MSTPLTDEARVMAQAVHLERKGEPEHALRLLESHEFGTQFDALAMMLKARILERLSIEQCAQTYQGAVEKYPGDAVVLLRVGVFVLRRGDTEKAKELLARSWNACPTPEAGYYLGSIKQAEGRTHEALEFFIQTDVMEGDEGYWKKRVETELTH